MDNPPPDPDPGNTPDQAANDPAPYSGRRFRRLFTRYLAKSHSPEKR